MARQYLDVTETEDLALQALYTATTGVSWHDNTGWDGATAGDCYGVTVAGGVVTALDLRANNLDGEFTAAVVAALTSCATIHVEGNPNLNVSFNLDDLPASVTDFVADYTDSDLAGGSSAMSAVDIEEISIRSASLSSLSVADIIDRIYADRASFNHATPILRIDNLEDETLAYLATHGVNVTPTELAEIDVNIKAIKAGTPVVLSSLTAKLSTVNGTAFVTQPSVDLRPYKDFKLSFSDGSNALVGWGKAYGTGETLGAELVTNGGMETGDPPSGWSPINNATLSRQADERTGGSGSYSLQAILGTGLTCVSQIFLSDAGQRGSLFKCTGWGKAVVGSLLALRIVNFGGTGGDLVSSESSGSWVYGEIGVTFSGTDLRVICQGSPVGSGTVRIDDCSAKKILTPDTTGLTIVSASGGSTYNWTSDGGIDPNAASFTLTITNS